MKEQLLAMQTACRDKTHIWPLLPIKPVYVLLEGKQESWELMISHQGVRMTNGSSDHWHLKLSGEIEMLLEGKSQLSLYEQMGTIEIAGFYRIKLWFESLLWLCRPYYETFDTA